MVTYCFWWKSEIFLSAKPEVELIHTIAPMENIFNVKYLENGERYDVGLKGNQIRNHQLAFDWRNDLRPWMICDILSPSCRIVTLLCADQNAVSNVRR